MFLSLPTHTNDVPRLEGEDDRDLVALINEARSPEAIEAISRSARARSRRRLGDSNVSRPRRGLRRALGRSFG